MGLVATVALGSAGAFAAERPSRASPADFVATVGARAIQVSAAKDWTAERRTRVLRNLFMRALDIDTMGRHVLGRHWRAASEAQRDRYATLFRDYVLGLQTVRLGEYAGEAFSVLRERTLRDDESLVVARLTRPEAPPLAMNFRVRETDGRMRIVDVTISGVSFILTKRSEFDAIIRQDGLAALLRQLDRKQAGLERRPQNVVPIIAEAMRVMQGSVNGLYAR